MYNYSVTQDFVELFLTHKWEIQMLQAIVRAV